MESYNSWLLTGFLLLLPLVVPAQVNNNNPWVFEKAPPANFRQSVNNILPNRYSIVSLHTVQLADILRQVSKRQVGSNLSSGTTLNIPLPNGLFSEFTVEEAPVMHPELAARFPLIKTYAGYELENPTTYLRFSVTPSGFHAMILSGSDGAVFIDPLPGADGEFYMVYDKKENYRSEAWSCSTEPETYRTPESGEGHYRSSHCQLRTYRLALACTGEYARFHGGTVSSALAAMVTTLTRVNGVYEQYLGISLQLVANNDKIIFLDPGTDPFNNNSGSAMLSQNQIACDNLIGNANYDIGHVFSTGGGGIAYMRNVCNASNKAGGVTGRSNPGSDPFDIDYVCHEIGHQFGASHTQANNCNRNGETAVEPGSGSTIMSYAGICNPNIQSNSDAYFHAASIAEIKGFISSGTCGKTAENFPVPVANAGPDYSIPRSTPFALRGQLDSGDSGNMLWNWEQMNTELATMPPLPGNLVGPNFRSNYPTNSSQRYFPNLIALKNNTPTIWEVLPEVSRTMKFRLTAIDASKRAGCASSDDVNITVVQNAGPFIITSPNGSESWTPGAKHFISWQVAGTASAPINCSQVDILLSLDGGLNYPHILAEKTANDGYEEITVPTFASTQARIMVRASGNVFFDISNADFTIISSPVLLVSTQAVNPNCFGDNKGKAVAIVSGGNGDYSYQWSNGASTQSIEGLSPGTYTVTVSSGPIKSTATVNIGQPSPLLLKLEGQDARLGYDGWAKVNASGGAGSYTYLWSTGSTASSVNGLKPGNYAVTVTDINKCKASGSINLNGTATVPMEYGTVMSVTNQWQSVRLRKNYQSMVVVASLVVLDNTGPAIITRIRNANRDSFEIRTQLAGNENAAVAPLMVHYFAAEEGVYNKEKHGITMEARKYYSTKTSQSTAWQFESQSYGQTYQHPVVLGQVMSFNDNHWSVFWSSKDGERYYPPTKESLSVGKHIAEGDDNNKRLPEIVGYIVFEEGSGQINGQKFTCGIGPPLERGRETSIKNWNNMGGMNEVESIIVASAAMNGIEGAWPVLKSTRPGISSLKVYVAEEKPTVGGNSQPPERVAYIAFSPGKPETASQAPQILGNPTITSNTLSLYPNPAVSDLNWLYELRGSGQVMVSLYDFLGRKVRSFTSNGYDDVRLSGRFEVMGLQPGWYLFELIDGNDRSVRPVIIGKK